MAAVTIWSDFGGQKNKVSHCFPIYLPMKWWDWMPWSSFSECWALSQLFHSPLSLWVLKLFSTLILILGSGPRTTGFTEVSSQGTCQLSAGWGSWYWGNPIPQSHGFSVSELHRAGEERTLQNLKQVLSLKQTDHKYAKTPIISQRKIKGIIKTWWTELQMNIQQAHCISYAANLA